MKTLDFSQTVSLLANIGVIAGIIFLAIELRQNNELLETEIDQQFFQNRITLSSDIVRDPTLAELMRRATTGEDLTEDETFRVFWVFRRIFQNFQWEYSQYEQGRISDLPIPEWKGLFQIGLARGMWARMADGFERSSPGFVQFMEEEIIEL